MDLDEHDTLELLHSFFPGYVPAHLAGWVLRDDEDGSCRALFPESRGFIFTGSGQASYGDFGSRQRVVDAYAATFRQRSGFCVVEDVSDEGAGFCGFYWERQRQRGLVNA